MRIKKTKFPVLFNNDTTAQLKKIGVKIEAEKYDIRNMIFYDVTAICQHIEDDDAGENHTEIFAGGDVFIITLPLEEVERIIDENAL
jgi:hypothetical protein